MNIFPWRKKKQPQKPWVLYHPDGVPVGMYPGDPVPDQNIMAIIDFIEQHGQPLGNIAPGETVQFKAGPAGEEE